MQFIHVRNIEKYHPGYKDRELLWAKIGIGMAEGDPEFEMIESEMDKWRFICFVLLELRAKKPLPLVDDYFKRKGFDIKKRPISLTINMLHKFIDIVTEDSELCTKSRVEESREDKNRMVFDFEEIWNKYPNQVGKKIAQRHFQSSVKTEQDWKDINTALDNYKKSDRVKSNYIQNGSTWFNNWKDWINYKNTNEIKIADRDLWRSVADKECSDCRGEGSIYAPGSGKYGKCRCVKT